MNSRVPLTLGRASSMALFASALLASLLWLRRLFSSALAGAACPPPSADSSDAANSLDAKLDLRVLIPRGSSTRRLHLSQHAIDRRYRRQTRLRPVNTVAPSRELLGAKSGHAVRVSPRILSGANETFVINTYDLNTGTETCFRPAPHETIRRGALNVLAVTLAGVPHSIELALQGAIRRRERPGPCS